jgi:hypothetical protein
MRPSRSLLPRTNPRARAGNPNFNGRQRARTGEDRKMGPELA